MLLYQVILVSLAFSACFSSKMSLKMPDVEPKVHDTYLCRSFEMPKEENYITQFIPHAKMETAHHMLLFSCSGKPFRSGKTAWNCGEMAADGQADDQFEQGPVCEEGEQQIIYAWAMDAPQLKLPKDVGFQVGANTIRKHLVLQVHYKNEQSAVVSGYRIRDGKWTEIGRKSPQLPEMFYNVTHPGMTIKKDDFIAARCTMVNNETREVLIGSTQKDEMCNFYIMYYTDDADIEAHTCSSPGYPDFSWRTFDGFSNADEPPSDASLVPGTTEVIEERLNGMENELEADINELFDDELQDDIDSVFDDDRETPAWLERDRDPYIQEFSMNGARRGFEEPDDDDLW